MLKRILSIPQDEVAALLFWLKKEGEGSILYKGSEIVYILSPELKEMLDGKV